MLWHAHKFGSSVDDRQHHSEWYQSIENIHIPSNGCLYSDSPHSLSCIEKKFKGNLCSLPVLLAFSRLVILFQRYYRCLRIMVMLILYYCREVTLEQVSGVTRVTSVSLCGCGWVCSGRTGKCRLDLDIQNGAREKWVNIDLDCSEN